jgi:hypothetical protein
MTRIARSILMGALALAVSGMAVAAEPTQAGSPTPAQKKMLKRARTPAKAPGDTIKNWPHNAEEGRTWVTASGEVIDVYCYLDRGFTGEVHRWCALICIKGGMPMGLLTNDGQIYLLTKHHEYAMDPTLVTYAKPYNDLVEWAAKQVQVTGYLIQRKGMKGIEVIRSKLLEEYLVPPGGIVDSTATRP